MRFLMKLTFSLYLIERDEKLNITVFSIYQCHLTRFWCGVGLNCNSRLQSRAVAAIGRQSKRRKVEIYALHCCCPNQSRQILARDQKRLNCAADSGRFYSARTPRLMIVVSGARQRNMQILIFVSQYKGFREAGATRTVSGHRERRWWTCGCFWAFS